MNAFFGSNKFSEINENLGVIVHEKCKIVLQKNETKIDSS